MLVSGSSYWVVVLTDPVHSESVVERMYKTVSRSDAITRALNTHREQVAKWSWVNVYVHDEAPVRMAIEWKPTTGYAS